MIVKKYVKISVAFIVILALSFSGVLYNQSYKIFAVSSADVYNTGNCTRDQHAVARAIQGRDNASGAKMFIDMETSEYLQAEQKWKEYYTNNKAINFTRINSLDEVLKSHASLINGLVVYDYNLQASKYNAMTKASLGNLLPVSGDMVDVGYNSNFLNTTGWNVSNNGLISCDGDIVTLSTASNQSWTTMYRTETINLDNHPILMFKPTFISSGASWYATIYTGGNTYWLTSGSSETGTAAMFNVKEATGLSGSQTIQFQLGVQGGSSKSVKFDWVKWCKTGYQGDFFTSSGWNRGGDSGSSFNVSNGNASLSTGSTGNTVNIYRNVTFNIDSFHFLEVKVDSLSSGATWQVVLRENGIDTVFPSSPSINTGISTFSLQKLGTSESTSYGTHTVELKLILSGGANKTGSFDWIRIGKTRQEEGNYINRFSIVEDYRGDWSSDSEAYNWAITNLFPSCHQFYMYTVGNEEILGTLGYDWAYANKMLCFRLPTSLTVADRKTLMHNIIGNLGHIGVIWGGWWEQLDEDVFVEEASLDQCYCLLATATNLSFHNKIPASTTRFNQARTINKNNYTLDTNKYYVTFVAAEGDTPRCATNFYNGNWFDNKRGQVKYNWGWDTPITDLFPAIAEYYINTATSSDYFLSQIPLGYTFLSKLPDKVQYGDTCKASFDNYNLALSLKWDKTWDMSIDSSFAQRSQISGMFKGIMATDDSTDSRCYPRVFKFENGAPYVQPDLSLHYVTKNADGSDLTPQGLRDLIVNAASKHQKPFFIEVFMHTWALNPNFNHQVLTKLEETINLLPSDYKVVLADEFFGCAQKAFDFQDDFIYKSKEWLTSSTGSMTITGGKARINSGTNSYNIVNHKVWFNDIDSHDTIEIKVDSVSSGANWKVAIWDRYGSGSTFYGPIQTATGTKTFSVKSITGWTSGIKKYDFQIIVENGNNKYIDVDWVRIR